MASAESLTTSSNAPGGGARYLVVARRYRPRNFEELLGQKHVAQALSNAITSHRVGHAYLFTGARGVGKTSAARIFAKALNCVTGPTPQPCNVCDICQSVDAGEDVDVLEIDGASNRGIDEIRQLRSNVSVRPSRARYKIYIIDEVHMLTGAAFNALLKTLEEPPEHVKFIFCTTDPEKIPITVLSRCQRFDFAPISSHVILDRLQQILRQEGRSADSAALELLARRAAGSMRDSQSLLEQLLAFCGPHITLEDVNSVLGVADNTTLEAIVLQLIDRQPAGALAAADEALRRGVEPGHLAEQLLTYFRDLLVAVVGGSPDLALQTDPAQWSELAERAGAIGPETLLATAQLLDQALVRMRQSTHARILLELALVRICALDRLDDLAELVQHLRHWDSGELPAPPPAPSTASARMAAPPAASMRREVSHTDATRHTTAARAPEPTVRTSDQASEPVSGNARTENTLQDNQKAEHSVSESPNPENLVSGEPAAAQKKSPAAAASDEAELARQEPAVTLTTQNASQVWQDAVSLLEGMTADFAGCADRIAISAPNRLAVYFDSAYNKDHCESPERKSSIERALRTITGAPVSVEFRVEAKPQQNSPPKPHLRLTQQQIMREKERHEFVVRAVELFGAEIVSVLPPESGREARGTNPSAN